MEQSYNSSGFVVIVLFSFFISDNSLLIITDKLTFHDT